MKKTMRLSLVVILLAGASQLAHAQAGVAIGIKGGLNFATLNANSSLSANYDSHTGYNFGGFVLFKFTKIGIQPEILFSQQGSKISYPTSTSSFTSTFNYVNIPVLFKLYTVA